VSLYKNNHGRLSFLNKLMMFPVLWILKIRNKKHINEGKKQLVVFSFDYIGQFINVFGIFEKDYLDTFFKWTESININFKGACVIDIGANIGNHSLYFSDYFKKVISFEPNDRTFKVLKLNAELVDNVDCYNVGLSDQNKKSYMVENMLNMGGSKVVDEQSTETKEIQLIRLDDFEGLENIKLIKIDVEGHELNALKGAHSTILKFKPIILFEQHPRDFINGESKVINYLKSLGYEKFALIKKDNNLFGKGLIKKTITPIYRLLFGEITSVVITNQFEKIFYDFIIAIPESIDLNPKVGSK